MSLLRRAAIAIAAVAITLLAVATGTAHAAPASGPAPSAMTTASPDGTRLITTLTNASFARTPAGDTLSIIGRDGRVLERVPLTVRLNGQNVALRPTVSADGRQATLTPTLLDATRAAIAAGMHPASAKKDRAYAQMIYHIQNGWNRGGNVATAVGAIAGLIIGCVVIVGCIWGAGVGAAIGAVVGINAGDPQAGQAILNWINTP